MPGKDGKGPLGKGTMTGQGRGGQSGSGKGRMGGRGLGAGGECLCPKCGARAPHTRGTPCFEQHCPQCGSTMARAS
ncbi:MAG TPA: hypothetical protein PLR60_11575 [Syntrophorhabdaceae bacterium]|nr:hypothetical protein [Syntrophorhabdaceae bacterium]